MELEKKVSSASAFRVPEKLVDLPQPLGGQVLTVKIRAVDITDIAEAFGSLPSLAADSAASDDMASMRDMVAQAEPIYRKLAAAGVIEPKFSFDGPADDAADWGALSSANRAALMRAILDLSGFSVPREVADMAGRFPGESGGEGVGGGSGGSVQIVRDEARAALGLSAPESGSTPTSGDAPVRSDAHASSETLPAG